MASFVESSLRSSGKVRIGGKRWCVMAVLSIILVALLFTSVFSRNVQQNKAEVCDDLDLKLVHVVSDFLTTY